jgi:hypothetical protein
MQYSTVLLSQEDGSMLQENHTRPSCEGGLQHSAWIFVQVNTKLNSPSHHVLIAHWHSVLPVTFDLSLLLYYHLLLRNLFYYETYWSRVCHTQQRDILLVQIPPDTTSTTGLEASDLTAWPRNGSSSHFISRSSHNHVCTCENTHAIGNITRYTRI